MAKLNEILRTLRQEVGLTPEQVARQLGVTRQAVSSYEAGRTEPAAGRYFLVCKSISST